MHQDCGQHNRRSKHLHRSASGRLGAWVTGLTCPRKSEAATRAILPQRRARPMGCRAVEGVGPKLGRGKGRVAPHTSCLPTHTSHTRAPDAASRAAPNDAVCSALCERRAARGHACWPPTLGRRHGAWVMGLTGRQRAGCVPRQTPRSRCSHSAAIPHAEGHEAAAPRHGSCVSHRAVNACVSNETERGPVRQPRCE